MSQPESLGIADAGRWSGVAASMVDYLGKWLQSTPSLTPPLGTIAGAERFLNHVLEGAALEQGKRIKPEISVMAGLSNWTIALDVITQQPGSTLGPEEIRNQIEKYLQTLQTIQNGEAHSPETDEQVNHLKDFFFQLLKHGSKKRHSAFAKEESPLG